MKFLPTSITEVIVVEPLVHSDERGFFMEAFRSDLMEAAGIPEQFVQDNHSGSHKNVLRGLHYQLCRPQGKLVRVLRGQVFDVAVDLRRSSPTFSRWVGKILSEDNKRMLWIPPGFAHGYYVQSDWAEVLYKTTEYYAPESDRTLLWNDSTIGIDWPLPPGKIPVLSDKDACGLSLSEADLYD